VELQPVRDVLVGNVRPALLVLFGAVVCVLLIACANVANLCLIRGAGRTREIALRLAIGAGRRRIVSQLLVESALLSLVGGVLGVALALAGIRGLAWLIPAASLGGATITLNSAVLAFASIAVFASTFLFGLAPAFGSARVNVQHDLKEGGRSATAGRNQNRWRAVLAVAEVALALVLVVGAGLMLRSLSRLLSVDSGIQADRVLTVQVSLRGPRYSSAAPVRQFWTDLIDGTASVEKPQLLLYEPEKNGNLRLVAVEYIILYTFHSRDAEPPVLFGQKFAQVDAFQLWGLHAWVWKDNPSGIFAPWNPSVNCVNATATVSMSH